MSEHDTREQLEADVRTFFSACDDGLCFCANGEEYFIELLDRQAAISERELCARCTPYATAKDYLDTIDELTAERDELRERMDSMKAVLDKWVKSTVGIEPPDCPITEFQPKDKDRRIAELTAERDLWNERARQAHDYALELTAESDELQAALKQERLEWESERDYANQCEERLSEMKAERDKWRARAEQVQESYLDAKDSRDNLQEAIDAMGNGQFYAMYEELRTEVDNLRKRNDNQADTIGRLRAEFDAALDDLARAVEDKRSHPF